MDLTRARKLAGIEPTRPGLAESHIADTIVQQMGGFGRIKVMLGAKVMKLADGMGIGIKWPNKERSRGNYVEIRLEPSDTYTMEFFNVSGSSKKSVKKYDDVYFDSLVDIFEKQTGWFLSLGGSKKPVGSGTRPSPELPPTGTKHEGRSVPTMTSRGMSFDEPVGDSPPEEPEGYVVMKKSRHYRGGPGFDNEVYDSEKEAEKAAAAASKRNPVGYEVLPFKHMESKLDDLRSMLGEADEKTDYIVVGVGGQTLRFKNLTKEEFIKRMAREGFKATGVHKGRQTRAELQGQPQFDDLLGPMWDGSQGIRYETQEVYDLLSMGAADDQRASLGEATAPKTVRDAKALISKLGLKTAEVRKTSRSFEVEISDEDEKEQFMKAIGDEWGGYTTGYGAVVLSPTYQSKGDWNDPTSRWHY